MKKPSPLDTTLQVTTPEGVEIQWRLAGFTSRGMAWFIDFLIRICIFVVFAILAGFIFGKSSGALILLSIFFLEWFYPVFFEVYRKGQSPGKKSMRLKVLMDNGAPVDLGASLIRNFLRVVDIYPFFYGLGMMCCLVDPKFRRLGDLAAKTIVAYTSPLSANPAPQQGSAQPFPSALEQEEQRALLEFLDRRDSLSPSRREELAEILQPIHQHQGPEAVEAMEAYARYLSGRV